MKKTIQNQNYFKFNLISLIFFTYFKKILQSQNNNSNNKGLKALGQVLSSALP